MVPSLGVAEFGPISTMSAFPRLSGGLKLGSVVKIHRGRAAVMGAQIWDPRF